MVASTDGHRLFLLWVVLSAASVGCQVHRGEMAEPNPNAPPQKGYLPQSPNRDVDVLFVIGSSSVMGEAQAGLAAGFPALLEALRSPVLGPDGSGLPCNELQPGGCRIPNLHVGIVSANLGAGGGKLEASPRVAGCTPPSKPFIAYAFDGKKGVTNIPGDPQGPLEAVAEAFACIASLGTAGEVGQPLEAARRALDPRANINPEFVRPDAVLAIVFVSDGDDRSACPTGADDCAPDGLWDLETRYGDFLNSLKPPRRVFVAAIAGSSAPRLEVMVDAFAPQSQLARIGEADLGPTLASLGKKILAGLGHRCIGSPPLTREGRLVCRQGDEYAPDTVCTADPGCLHEAACEVIGIVGQGTRDEKTTLIPRCPLANWYPVDWRTDRDCGGDCPCWRIVRKEQDDCDPALDGTPYDVDVLRADGEAPGALEARCLTTPERWGTDGLGELDPCAPSGS